MKTYSEQKWTEWFDHLSNNDFLVIDNFITDDLYQEVRNYFKQMINQEEFSKAGIGASGQHQIQSSIRGDMVYWLDRQRDYSLSGFFELADDLVNKLRRYCFLSISDYEFHLAHYPVGTKYEKHIDQFQGRTNRMISVLIYLNESWKPGDGGELKIYQPTSEFLVEPVAKRLVMFRSDSVEHEVLVTHTGRMSITGWLLHQPSSLGYIMS